MLPNIAAALPQAQPSSEAPSEVGSACGAELGDCLTLTCIPLDRNCTTFATCRGTCQALDNRQQQVYTLCGGWTMYDDCDERTEACVADPRHRDSCGPSCDGPGICFPLVDECGGGADANKCPDGKVCFKRTSLCSIDPTTGVKTCPGSCFPLRFGSDGYAKSRLEEIVRTDQDGYQEEN